MAGHDGRVATGEVKTVRIGGAVFVNARMASRIERAWHGSLTGIAVGGCSKAEVQHPLAGKAQPPDQPFT